jgi:hypothetical protein
MCSKLLVFILFKPVLRSAVSGPAGNRAIGTLYGQDFSLGFLIFITDTNK